MTNDEAAALLGCPTSEIGGIEDAASGTVIVMVDGSSYIDVPAETPDADGKTGLMYRELPHGTYLGTFPVYAPTAAEQEAAIPAESEPEVVDEPDAEPTDSEPDAAEPEPDAPAVPVRGKPAKAAG